MPRRTNEFQRLVKVVHDHLAGMATVTESAMVEDASTGEKREVDVYVEAEVAGRRVAISIECRDHQRVADVGWVEQMIAKHNDLPTDRLVLASRNGFTEPARTKAARRNVELIDLQDGVDVEDAARLVVGTDGVVWTKSWESQVRLVRLALETPEMCWYHDALPIDALFVKDGQALRAVGPVAAVLGPIVDREVRSHSLSSPFSELDVASVVEFSVDASEVTGEPLHIVGGSSGGSACVHRIDVVVDVTTRARPVPLTHGTLGGAPVAFGTWTPMDDPKMIVISEADELKITVTGDPALD